MEMKDNSLGPMIAEIAEPPILIPCTICGRTFKSESLRKHQGVCQKNATKKRRVFDSMKQRIQGTELAEYISIPVVPPKPKLIPVNKVVVTKSLSNRQANDSPHAAHSVNTPNTERSRNVAVRSNSISSTTPSRSGAALKEERCPHCDRTFGWKAFSRHEEWCREHKTRLAQSQSPAAVMKAKEMLDARIKYRAPLVGKLKRPTNRQKYSGGVTGTPTVSHSLPKSSVTDVHLQNILSPKTSTPSSNRESRKKSTPKTSTVSTPSAIAAHQPDMRKTSATTKRDVSPLKEIPHIINPPWDLNIANEEGMDAKESTSGSRNRATPQENNDEYAHREAYYKQCSSELANEENSKEESLEQMIKNVKNILEKMSKNSAKNSTETKDTIHNGERITCLRNEEDTRQGTYSPKYSKEKDISANIHKHFNKNVSQSTSFKKGVDENGTRLKNNYTHKSYSADPDVHFTSEDNLDYSRKLSVDPTENLLNILGQGDGDFADIIDENMQRTFVFRILESPDCSDDNIDRFTEDRFEEISDNTECESGDHKKILKTPEFNGKKINDENKTNLVNITENSYSRPSNNSVEDVSRKSFCNIQEVAKNESGILCKNIETGDSSEPQKNVNTLGPSMPKLNDCSVNSESIFVSKFYIEKGSNLVTWKEISQPNANKEDNLEKEDCGIDVNTSSQTLTCSCDEKLTEGNKQKVDDKKITQTCPSENEKKKPVHFFKKTFNATFNEKVCKSDKSHMFSETAKENSVTEHKKSKLPIPVPKSPKSYIISFKDDSSLKNNQSTNSDKPDSFHVDGKTEYFCKNLNSTFILSETLEENSDKCLHDSNLSNTEKGSHRTSSNETSPVRQKGIIRKCKPDEFERVTWLEMHANKGISEKYCLSDYMQSESHDDNGVVISGIKDGIFCNNKGDDNLSTEKLCIEVNDGKTASPTQEIGHEVKMWSYGAFTNTNGYWDRKDNDYPIADFSKLEDIYLSEMPNTSTCDLKESNENLGNSFNSNHFVDRAGTVPQVKYPKQFCFDPNKIKGRDDRGILCRNSNKINQNSCLFQEKSAPLSLEDLATNPSKNNDTHIEEKSNKDSNANKTHKQIRKVNDNVDVKATCTQGTQSNYANIYSSKQKKHHSACIFLKPNATGITNEDENAINSMKKMSSMRNGDEMDSKNHGIITEVASFPEKIHCENKSVFLSTKETSSQDMKKNHSTESDVSKDLGGLCKNRSKKDGEVIYLSDKNSVPPQNKDNIKKCGYRTSSNHTDISNKTITLEDRDIGKFMNITNSNLNKNLGAENLAVNKAKFKETRGNASEEVPQESSAVTSRETSSRTYDLCTAASSSEVLNYANLSENSSSSYISISSSNPSNSNCCTNPPDLSRKNSPNLTTVLKKYNICVNHINVKADVDNDNMCRLISSPSDQKFYSKIFSSHNSLQQSPKYTPSTEREHNESSNSQKISMETDSQNSTPLNTNMVSDKTVKPLTHKKVMIEEEYDSDEAHHTHLPSINNNVVSSQIEWLNLVHSFDKSNSNSIPKLKEAKKMDSNALPVNDSCILDFKRKETNIRKRLFREVRSLESTPRKLPRNLEASNVWKSDSLKEEAGDCKKQFSVHRRMLAENRIKKRLQSRQTNETLKQVVGESSDLSNCTLTLPCKHPIKKNTVSPSSKQLPPMKPVSCSLFKGTSHECTNESSEDDKGGGQSPVEKPSYRLSTYDPYSKAEMQLRELLSDGGSIQKPKIMQSTPAKDAHENQIIEPTLQTHHVASKNNGNLDFHDIYANQRQAKEDILPDMFTETSTQLNFEMPNFMRGREETSITKRRAMKPTAQNMGIELNPVTRENIMLRRDYVTNDTEIKSKSAKELFTELENKFPGNSNLVKGMAKSEAGDQIDIESIHQSINLVALGLSNLSTSSQKSLIDEDNNNALSGGKSIKERADNVEYSGNLSEMDKRIALTTHSTRPTSSGDGESEGDGKRIRRRKKRGKSEQGDEVREDVSSPDSLVSFQPRVSAKPSVDSAYSSLNRPSFRAIEDAKKAINKAFDPHNQQTSSGEDDHADEWSEEDVPKNEPSRWNTSQNVIEPSSDFKLAKFCHECGSRYPLTEAKFCCVCGVRRLTV